MNKKKRTNWLSDKDAIKRLQAVWRLMLQRCENSADKSYQRYGGKGISVCPEWHNFNTFACWAVESGYDPYAGYMQCTLDRIDNDGDYSPTNCRWVDMKTQANNRCNNHLIEFRGEVHTVSEWADITNIPITTIYKRAEMGLSAEEILNPKYRTFNMVSVCGEPMTMSKACKKLGMPYGIVQMRLYRGWSEKAAFVNVKGICREEAERMAEGISYGQAKTL